MSVVACKVHKDKIRMAADSIVVRGNTQDKRDKYAKLNKINNMIIGGVGYLKDISLLMLFCDSRRPRGVNEFDVLEFMSDFFDWKKKKTDDTKTESTFILVFDGVAFLIEDFLVKQITDFEAIGAGMDYALAALHLGHDADKAAEVACELSVFCEKPVNVIDYKF